MTTTIKSIPTEAIELGKAYKVVRATNDAGQSITGIRATDWRTVLITTENVATYTEGPARYYIQEHKERHAVRLLADGWYRFSRSQGMCGEFIVTEGPLYGLACEKPAYWRKGAGPAMCANHGVLHLA